MVQQKLVVGYGRLKSVPRGVKGDEKMGQPKNSSTENVCTFVTTFCLILKYEQFKPSYHYNKSWQLKRYPYS
jgi:hypothetical protein